MAAESPVTVKIQRLHDLANVPSYTRAGDAALDITSVEDKTLKPFERALVSFGFALEIPENYCALVLPRSGLAVKHGLSLVNAPGLIDSNYRGEVKGIFINLDPNEPFEIHAGDRVAQLFITQAQPVSMVEATSLSDTQRGAGGFGSSGQ